LATLHWQRADMRPKMHRFRQTAPQRDLGGEARGSGIASWLLRKKLNKRERGEKINQPLPAAPSVCDWHSVPLTVPCAAAVQGVVQGGGGCKNRNAD
jgi:hypothetical protein